jgi:hypothetical protein
MYAPLSGAMRAAVHNGAVAVPRTLRGVVESNGPFSFFSASRGEMSDLLPPAPALSVGALPSGFADGAAAGRSAAEPSSVGADLPWESKALL